MDLDTASDVEDVAGSFTNRWNLDAFAISPSGSQIAIASSGLGSGSSRNLAVLEARTQKKLYDTVLRFNEDSDLEVAFAGESALVVAERGCPGNFCFKTPVPHGRTLTVWNFGEDGSVREFGVDGAETYKWTGASSDGSVIYAYTGTEKFCKSCNGGSGELKIEDARFMLWDRRTGKPLARSPKLQVQDHRCPTVLILGACTAYQQSPELQLSENGNAMLAFWPRGTTPWQKDEERIVQVLTRHE